MFFMIFMVFSLFLHFKCVIFYVKHFVAVIIIIIIIDCQCRQSWYLVSLHCSDHKAQHSGEGVESDATGGCWDEGGT